MSETSAFHSCSSPPNIYISLPVIAFFQIADAVVVARYIGATLVLPDIRGSKPGDERLAACHFHDNHPVGFFIIIIIIIIGTNIVAAPFYVIRFI
jgi:hypothetical protein